MTTGADVGLLAAFAGGVVSFASPCVLPVVPAYVSVLTGVRAGGDAAGASVRRVLATATGFVAGFSAVFVVLGLSATAAGQLLAGHRLLLTRLSGLVVLAMALFLAGSLVLRAPWLYQERRWHPRLERFGPLAAPVAGIAFGLGWTPCIGPVLTSVLAVATTSEQTGHGALLLLAYSAGLAVPFLVAALALDRMAGTFGLIRRHGTLVTAASAVLLGGFGVLLALNLLPLVTTAVQQALEAIGLGGLLRLG